MKNVKVLHVTFDMGLGGTEQVIKQIVEATSASIQHAIVCIDGQIKELGNLLQQQGIPLFAMTRKSGLDFQLLKQLRKLVIEQEFDVIHCHQYTPYVYGLLACAGLKSKVVFTEHGRFYPDSYKWKRWLLNPLLSCFTDEVTAISQATKNALIKYENFPRNKVKVVYNGLNNRYVATEDKNAQLRAELGINPSTVIFGTVSRLDPIKNHRMMLQAFAQVVNKCPDTKLVIVGDGPIKSELETLTNELKLTEHVIFTGFIVNPQRYLAMMDVFLLTSFSEGTSMTLLEAMANKVPAIVTKVGGNPEIVNPDSGILINSNKTDELVDAMLTLLNSAPLRQKLAQNAFEIYRTKFTEHEMANNYIQLYTN